MAHAASGVTLEIWSKAATAKLKTDLTAHFAADWIKQKVEAALVGVPHPLTRAKAQPGLVFDSAGATL
ncbi:hypothetical protein [Rhizobium leguminosarum]|uniref:hypothetical protein n=1 Tax=Rhizobium leguminosarum TaxID=384 RepID=UPI0014410E4D|nr:hypothetical protein [Rhizobium leguminosarum]